MFSYSFNIALKIAGHRKLKEPLYFRTHFILISKSACAKLKASGLATKTTSRKEFGNLKTVQKCSFSEKNNFKNVKNKDVAR